MRNFYYPFVILLVTVLAFLLVRFLTGPEDRLVNSHNVQTGSTQIANPASQNCIKLGGELVIKKNDNNDEYGVCIFEDNRQCEEWALFRGECPKTGVKITGFDSEDQVFCAISGGQVQATGGSECLLPDGRVCINKMLFNGQCNSGKTK